MAFWPLLLAGVRSTLLAEAVRKGPDIIRAAHELVRDVRAKQSPEVKDLTEEVEQLRRDSGTQAQLISELAEQLKSLTDACQLQATRLQLATWLAGGAVALGLGLLLFRLFT